MCACLLVIEILCIPYTLYHWSSNFGIRTRDMAIVQLYLDHFQILHPELTDALERAYAGYQSIEDEFHSSFWPNSWEEDIEKGSEIKYASMNGRKFSLAAGFFTQLDKAGFSRQALMEFLMHHVELEAKVDEQERDEYRRVMYKLCARDLVDMILPWGGKGYLTNGEGFLTPGKTPTGMTPYLLRDDHRMDWILQKDVVLVPMDWDTHSKAAELTKFGLFPLWKAVRDDIGLKESELKGCWQLVDLR